MNLTELEPQVPTSEVAEFLGSVPSELFLVSVHGQPAVGLRPAQDDENVLLLRSFHMPGKKNEVPAETFHKGYMTFQPARWLTPEEEAEMVTASPAGTKKKKKRVRGS